MKIALIIKSIIFSTIFTYYFDLMMGINQGEGTIDADLLFLDTEIWLFGN